MTIAVCLLLAGSAIGAAAQRLTGIGFGLVSLPFYMLAYGAWDAVTIVVSFGILVSAILTWTLREDIDRARMGTLGIWSVLGTPIGAWLAMNVDARELEVCASVLLIAGLVLSGRLPQLGLGDPASLRRGAGVSIGVTNAAAGLPGVPLIIYSRVCAWNIRSMVATMQPLGVVVGTATLLSRWVGSGHLLPGLSLATWAGGVASIFLGFAVAKPMGERLPLPLLLNLVVAIAYLGSFAVLVRAVASL